MSPAWEHRFAATEHVIVGPGTLARLAEECSARGYTRVVVVTGRTLRERTPVPRAPGGHVDLYRAVVRWVLDGGPPPVDPADAARTARVLDAAQVSAAERRVVLLD